MLCKCRVDVEYRASTDILILALKAIVALIYANFTTSIYQHGEMRPSDAYVSAPVGGEEFSIILRNV